MFEYFCLQDILETVAHADCTLYHLDGPGAIKHLPVLLEIKALTAIQWVQGAGNPPPGQWIELIRRIQSSGKGVQVLYSLEHALTCEEMIADVEHLLKSIDPTKLFIWADVNTRDEADELVERLKETTKGR